MVGTAHPTNAKISVLQSRKILFSWRGRPEEDKRIEPKKTKKDAKTEHACGPVLPLSSFLSPFFVSFG